jgi:hydrogenase maturation protease
VGFRVAERLRAALGDRPEIAVTEASVGGLELLDLLCGYDRAIVIDAIQTAGGRPGDVYRLEPEAFSTTRHATNPHDVSFTGALELGKRLGLAMPARITVFAIEVREVDSFSEECSPEVERAVAIAADKVMAELAANIV